MASQRMPVVAECPWLRSRGFTVFELMIVALVIAILTAMAVPSYVDSIRRGRRTEALEAVQDVALAFERWRLERGTYAGAADALRRDGAAQVPARGAPTYRLTLTSEPLGFTVVALPDENGPMRGDACGGVAIDETGTVRSTASSAPVGCFVQ